MRVPAHPARRTTVALLAWLLALAPSAALGAGSTLQVAAAASLSDAFRDLARRLEQSRPGLRVQLDLAGSQQLALQLEQGAPADVFASADERWMAYARERGLVRDSPVVFARNRLVVILPRSNPARLRRLQDLARDGVKLVIGADAVPVGRYSRQALRNLSRAPGFGGDFATRVLRNVVSEEENVRNVVGKVQLGEADAGIVYRSDVGAAQARSVSVLELPDSANVIASYPIAITAHAAQSEAARAFVALVLSSEGQALLAKHGFSPAGAAPPR